jgi:putative transposase
LSHSISLLSHLDVLRHAHHRLAQHLKLTAEGYRCSTTQLLHLLLGLAASRDTLESVCSQLRNCPSAAAFRRYLNDHLQAKDLPALQTSLNLTLAAAVPASLRHSELEVAIDYHDHPYYGNSEQETGLWVRAKAKAGTTRVYRLATAYVILAGRRFTLALQFVTAKQTHPEVLDFLLKRVKALKIKASCLYLDRGFATVEVVKFLRRRRQKAILACPLRGRRGGLKALCVGAKSYGTSYDFGSKKAMVRVRVALYRERVKKPKKGKPKVVWLAYLLVGIKVSARQAKKRYRRRFGIESSYRCARQVRGWTTSQNASYRFLLLGLSFVLENIWLELRWQWARKPGRGRAKVKESHFRLRRLAEFILSALETLYGKVCHINRLSESRASP